MSHLEPPKQRMPRGGGDRGNKSRTVSFGTLKSIFEGRKSPVRELPSNVVPETRKLDNLLGKSAFWQLRAAFESRNNGAPDPHTPSPPAVRGRKHLDRAATAQNVRKPAPQALGRKASASTRRMRTTPAPAPAARRAARRRHPMPVAVPTRKPIRARTAAPRPATEPRPRRKPIAPLGDIGPVKPPPAPDRNPPPVPASSIAEGAHVSQRENNVDPNAAVEMPSPQSASLASDDATAVKHASPDAEQPPQTVSNGVTSSAVLQPKPAQITTSNVSTQTNGSAADASSRSGAETKNSSSTSASAEAMPSSSAAADTSSSGGTVEAALSSSVAAAADKSALPPPQDSDHAATASVNSTSTLSSENRPSLHSPNEQSASKTDTTSSSSNTTASLPTTTSTSTPSSNISSSVGSNGATSVKPTPDETSRRRDTDGAPPPIQSHAQEHALPRKASDANEVLPAKDAPPEDAPPSAPTPSRYRRPTELEPQLELAPRHSIVDVPPRPSVVDAPPPQSAPPVELKAPRPRRVLSPERCLTEHPPSPYEGAPGTKPDTNTPKSEQASSAKTAKPTSSSSPKKAVKSPRVVVHMSPAKAKSALSPRSSPADPPTSPYHAKRETDSEEKVTEAMAKSESAVDGSDADVLAEDRHYDSRFSVFVKEGGDIGVRPSENTQASASSKSSSHVASSEEKAALDVMKDAERSLESIGLSEKTVFGNIQRTLMKQPETCVRLAQTPEDVVASYPLWMQVVVKYAERIVSHPTSLSPSPPPARQPPVVTASASVQTSPDRSPPPPPSRQTRGGSQTAIVPVETGADTPAEGVAAATALATGGHPAPTIQEGVAYEGGAEGTDTALVDLFRETFGDDDLIRCDDVLFELGIIGQRIRSQSFVADGPTMAKQERRRSLSFKKRNSQTSLESSSPDSSRPPSASPQNQSVASNSDMDNALTEHSRLEEIARFLPHTPPPSLDDADALDSRHRGGFILSHPSSPRPAPIAVAAEAESTMAAGVITPSGARLQASNAPTPTGEKVRRRPLSFSQKPSRAQTAIVPEVGGGHLASAADGAEGQLPPLPTTAPPSPPQMPRPKTKPPPPLSPKPRPKQTPSTMPRPVTKSGKPMPPPRRKTAHQKSISSASEATDSEAALPVKKKSFSPRTTLKLKRFGTSPPASKTKQDISPPQPAGKKPKKKRGSIFSPKGKRRKGAAKRGSAKLPPPPLERVDTATRNEVELHLGGPMPKQRGRRLGGYARTPPVAVATAPTTPAADQFADVPPTPTLHRASKSDFGLSGSDWVYPRGVPQTDLPMSPQGTHDLRKIAAQLPLPPPRLVTGILHSPSNASHARAASMSSCDELAIGPVPRISDSSGDSDVRLSLSFGSETKRARTLPGSTRPRSSSAHAPQSPTFSKTPTTIPSQHAGGISPLQGPPGPGERRPTRTRHNSTHERQASLFFTHERAASEELPKQHLSFFERIQKQHSTGGSRSSIVQADQGMILSANGNFSRNPSSPRKSPEYPSSSPRSNFSGHVRPVFDALSRQPISPRFVTSEPRREGDLVSEIARGPHGGRQNSHGGPLSPDPENFISSLISLHSRNEEVALDSRDAQHLLRRASVILTLGNLRAASNDPPILEGHLRVKVVSTFRKQWRERFCVLYNDCMLMYKTGEKMKAKDSLLISVITRVDLSRDDGRLRRSYRFDVHTTSDQKLSFRCDDAEKCHKWVQELRNLMQLSISKEKLRNRLKS